MSLVLHSRPVCLAAEQDTWSTYITGCQMSQSFCWGREKCQYGGSGGQRSKKVIMNGYYFCQKKIKKGHRAEGSDFPHSGMIIAHFQRKKKGLTLAVLSLNTSMDQSGLQLKGQVRKNKHGGLHAISNPYKTARELWFYLWYDLMMMHSWNGEKHHATIWGDQKLKSTQKNPCECRKNIGELNDLHNSHSHICWI